ncbi:AraC family transcriptional regulator [Paenibacillus wenxiniae]|uniref:Helix-turn-helix domain-containing protein n=1 Tax=Paenibacillus wenxiniae TaxID=1636843 RepID=A0ABW4RL80_9BACL
MSAHRSASNRPAHVDASMPHHQHTPSNLTDQRMPDRLIAEYMSRSDYFVMPGDHLHPHYELYILLSGERRYFVRDQVYEMHTGDLVFIGKHELHRTLPGKLPEHERIVLYFGDGFAKQQFGEHRDWLLSLFNQPYPVLHTGGKDSKDSILSSIIQQLVRELTIQPQGYKLMVQQLAVTLLLYCARLPRAAPTSITNIQSATQEPITEAARYIKAHYHTNVSLSQLAAHVHLSPAHLSRMFKRTTGFHVTEYINTVRVRAAQQQLRDTDLKIIDIAAATGFGNFSHFGKIFKQLCHMSPREYRQSTRGK